MIFLPENPCCSPVPPVNTIPCPGSNPCSSNIVSSDYVGYSGPNLPCTTIQTCNTLTVSLQKLDEQICYLKNAVYFLQEQIQHCCTTTTTTTTTGIPCHCYVVGGAGPSSPIYAVDYTDCDGVAQSTSAGGGIGAAFCAQLGSVVTLSSGLVDNGVCTGDCPPCNCTQWVFTGDGTTEFEYVPCGGITPVTFIADTTPIYQCVNNNYPVTQIAGTPGFAGNTQVCCP